jgi:hypothetical protein
MSTATVISASDPIVRVADIPDSQRFVFRGISWERYRELSRIFESRHLRLTYDRGTESKSTSHPCRETAFRSTPHCRFPRSGATRTIASRSSAFRERQVRESRSSLFFPFLTPEALESFLKRRSETDEETLLDEFTEWVRQQTAPSRRTKKKR